jgi:hypothetical protein
LVAPQSFKDPVALKQLLKVELEGYWKNHYTFDGIASNKDLSIGEKSVENIKINTLAPFFIFYSKKLLKPLYSELSVHILVHSEFEINAKTKLFEAKKSCLKSAADSQAVLNLYDNYCSKKKCLSCGIWAALIGSKPVY